MKYTSFDPMTLMADQVGLMIKKASLVRQKKLSSDQYLLDLQKAQALQKERAERRFNPKYPDLPITQKLDDLRKVLMEHPVVIVEGETGSGKTTQIPKLCLELGFSDRGLIACTQPRRIAATSICTRLREELEDETLVGAKIRFYEDLPEGMRLQVMTDGVLLQEYRNDPWLRKYTCIILDEAHERSLNMDLLLGIFQVIRERRPDLKFVVTSATMDAEMFSKFFGGAPIIKVEGRTFPVQIRYAAEVDDLNLDEKATAAILALMEERPDHLLCFLPTERDILETKQLLLSQTDRYEVLPLFARMPQGEQKKVFAPSHKPKVILSTNVAETSLTIPGIAYVVDTGLARVLRYQPQSRIQALPLERISKASAGQRAGRAGRVKPGVCIRLYSEEDFADRPDYTDPEILRSSLDNVVLQLRQLNLDPEAFPFVQAPVRTALKGAASHLWEIGALADPTPQAELTSLGRRMVGLPLDAVLARILIQAFDNGIVIPVAVVCAALSLSEIRLNPQDPAEKLQAENAHRVFKGPGSDFYQWLRIWNAFWQESKAKVTRNRIRNFCKKHFLSFQRMSEWIDLFEQFMDLLKVKSEDYGVDLEKLHEDLFHQCLLSGLVAGVARKDVQSHSYRLNGGKEAFLVASSSLYKKKPDWVLSANIRETQRVYLTANAEISSLWVYKLFPQLCKKTYHDPQYNPKTGFVEALEEVRFRNFILSRSKRVNFERIDPEQSAEIFFRDGLATGALPKTLEVLKGNSQTLELVKELEAKLRINGLSPSAEELGAMYRASCPEVTSFKSLQNFLRIHGEERIRLKLEDLLEARRYEKLQSWMNIGETLPDFVERIMPAQVQLGAFKARLQARLDPGRSLDGMSVSCPKEHWLAYGPCAWALQLPAWRMWIWSKVVSVNSREVSAWLESQMSVLVPAWLQALQNGEAASPLLCLWRVIAPLASQAEHRVVMPKSWEKFEQLHMVDGELVADMAPHSTDYQWLLQVSAYFFRREHRGKVDLLDYDRVVLGLGALWMAPCAGKQGPEIRSFAEPSSAYFELQKLRMDQPLRRIYPVCVQQMESFVHALLRQVGDRAGMSEQIKTLQSTVCHAFVTSLAEEQKQNLKEIPAELKEGFRLPKMRSGAKVQGKGLESLASLNQNKQNPEEKMLSVIVFYGLSHGPKSQVLWWEWLKLLEGQPSKEIKQLLGLIGSVVDIQDLRARPGLAYGLAAALIQELGVALPQCGTLDLTTLIAVEEANAAKAQSLSKEIRAQREIIRQRLLPYEGFLEEKQKIQGRFNALEKQAWSGELQKEWLEIMAAVDELEWAALRRGVDMGSAQRRPLQMSKPQSSQADCEEAPSNDALLKLKSMFGKVR